MANAIYGLFKVVLAFLFMFPLMLVIGLVDFLNSKGQLNEIEKDLKNLLSWLSGGDY